MLEQHTATLAEHTEQLGAISRVQAEHGEQLKQVRRVQSDQTGTLNDLSLKVDEVGRTLSVHRDDMNLLVGDKAVVDRQLHDLRRGLADLNGKADRILAHLGVAQGD